MGTLISLDQYRSHQKRLYMERYGARLEKFIEAFVLQNFKTSFALVNQHYLTQRVNDNEEAWDYYDFRDLLKEGIAVAFGDQVWDEVRNFHWFDSQWLSRDEVIDKVVTVFILGKTGAASSL